MGPLWMDDPVGIFARLTTIHLPREQHQDSNLGAQDSSDESLHSVTAAAGVFAYDGLTVA